MVFLIPDAQTIIAVLSYYDNGYGLDYDSTGEDNEGDNEGGNTDGMIVVVLIM